MERDFLKFAEYLAKNAREGVLLEKKIAEWKRAEKDSALESPSEHGVVSKVA